MTNHRYRISIVGGLGRVAREGFEGLEIRAAGRDTDLIGELDQSGLFGVLHRIQTLSLELISVHRED